MEFNKSNMIDKEMIHEILRNLSSIRPVFHSEDDFKFSFSWELNGYLGDNAEIRLEERFGLSKEVADNKEAYLDIFLLFNKKAYPIELKYKTTTLKMKVQGESYDLKEHAGLDTTRYDYIRDISRIENIRHENFPLCKGFAIFLTNSKPYWDSNRAVKESLDKNFKIDEQRAYIPCSKLAWNCDYTTEQLKKKFGKKRIKPLELKKQYEIEWKDYSILDKKIKFRYLLVVIDLNTPH